MCWFWVYYQYFLSYYGRGNPDGRIGYLILLKSYRFLFACAFVFLVVFVVIIGFCCLGIPYYAADARFGAIPDEKFLISDG